MRDVARNRRLNLAQILCLLPAISILFFLFIGAFAFAVAQSLGFAPQYGVHEFLTFRYYSGLFGDDRFWTSTLLTFYYAIVPTLVGAVLSVALALVMAKRFKAKIAAQFIYKIPMVVPYLVGVSLVIVLFANGGVIARFLFLIGAISSPSDFPRVLQTSNGIGIMLVYLWKQVPFMTLVIYSNLLVVGRQDEDSAILLGASRYQIFKYITLPKLLPSLVTATLIVFAFNFGSFEVPFILGVGYPNTLPVEAWRLFDSPDYTNRPAAMAIVTLIVVMSMTCLFTALYWFRRLERKRGRV